MREFTDKMTMQQAGFLVKQQVVYLEKSLCFKKENNIPFYFACLWSDSWKMQSCERTYDALLTLQMDKIRSKLSSAFQKQGGTLEVRFFDLDLLTLVFSDCSEEMAREFCNTLRNKYHVTFCGQIPISVIAPSLFDAVYGATGAGCSMKEKELHLLSVGLSYQQNYLVDVVSRDRGESKELLFLEAVDQVLLDHHTM